jgi:hypothetical protein
LSWFGRVSHHRMSLLTHLWDLNRMDHFLIHMILATRHRQSM